MSGAPGLATCDRPLVDAHDAVLLDLDGVVQLGEQPVRYAVDVLADLRGRGMRVVFVTNNASRSASDVAARLCAMPIEADAGQVVTSAMVAADLLAQRLPAGSAVLVVGGPGLVTALEAASLRAVRSAADDVVAVVQGWAPEVDWSQLAEATVALRAGAAWVATNDDRTLPSPRGPLPGNGSMVAALSTATGLRPEVMGKPHPPLFDVAIAHAAATRPLFVGDRLDTDIVGARRAGVPSMLVLTGVAQIPDLLAASPDMRPSYVGFDLRALKEGQPEVTLTADGAQCADSLVTTTGVARGRGVPALRAACALAWSNALPSEMYDDVGHSLLEGIGATSGPTR